MLFSLVFIYLVTVIGIPVYIHYCGGELERINYMVKGDSCCGDEDEGCNDESDCCKDENLVLKSSLDFTFKSFDDHQLVKSVNESLFVELFYQVQAEKTIAIKTVGSEDPPPPERQQGKIVETSVIRI